MYLVVPDLLVNLFWIKMLKKDLNMMSNAIRALTIDAIEKANSGLLLKK